MWSVWKNTDKGFEVPYFKAIRPKSSQYETVKIKHMSDLLQDKCIFEPYEETRKRFNNSHNEAKIKLEQSLRRRQATANNWKALNSKYLKARGNLLDLYPEVVPIVISPVQACGVGFPQSTYNHPSDSPDVDAI